MPFNKRGRSRGIRWITEIPEITYFKPFGIKPSELRTILISLEELESLRLVDYDGMKQEEAASYMRVSRRTLWNDLKNARKKVIAALLNGWGIRISGGNYAIRGEITDEWK
jgi:predicted DNA-binding protein (UPF0251 family)